MSFIPQITAEEFQAQVLDSPLPVLVDLYAPWCMPCKVMGQVLERLAPDLEGRAKVVKVNTDEEPELAAAFGVSSIPMLVLVHQGKAVDASIGVVPTARVLEMVAKAASAAPVRATTANCCGR